MNNEYDINKLLGDIKLEINLHHNYGNDIYLTDKEKDIIEKYGFNINNYLNIEELLFDLDEYINNNYDLELNDLEEVVSNLSEFNYYQNTNK